MMKIVSMRIVFGTSGDNAHEIDIMVIVLYPCKESICICIQTMYNINKDAA
jgi:hypothetical protein